MTEECLIALELTAVARVVEDRYLPWSEQLDREISMDLGLRGLKALVTGGTKGIGLAIAETLAAEGCDVAICARNSREVAATVTALATRGVKATGAAVDVSDGPKLKAWVAEAAAALNGLDIIVANVSAMAVSDDDEGWSKGFSTDMMGTVRLVDAAAPFLLASKAAAIVTISSVSAREVDADAGPYGVFKAAIIHYTQLLAQKWAAQGVRANTISPGTTYFEGGIWNQIRDEDPALYQMALDLNPSGRMGTPQEIANAAVFLASPAASFISGANLVVDGALSRGVHL